MKACAGASSGFPTCWLVRVEACAFVFAYDDVGASVAVSLLCFFDEC